MNVVELLTVAILVARPIDSEQTINRCCRPPEVYNEKLDRCAPEGTEVKESRSSNFHDNETSSEFLILPRVLVKHLDGQNETQVKFKIHNELPEGEHCSNGSFITTFCTASNRSECPENVVPLLLTTRAQLKISDEYYSPKEFCIIGSDKKALEIRVCNPVCSQEVPCVRKCCDVDQVWNFQNGSSKARKRCTLSGSKSWRPHFYLSGSRQVPKDHNDPIHPHYFIAHPRSFYIKNKTTIFTEEQVHRPSKKFSWIFHVGLNKNYYKRKSRYSWTNSEKVWNTSCVDGVINSAYRESSGFQGMQEEDVLIVVFPNRTGNEPINFGLLVVYVLCMILSALFILLTLVVHVLLWDRQTLHGWTLMSYWSSLFLFYDFLAFKYIHAVTTERDQNADALCVFIGVMLNFLYLCTFCWLTVQNFDLWLTFRKVQVRSKSSLGVRRYLAYATFGLALPFVFVATGLTLDALYVNEPEATWIIPEYGLHQCGPHSEIANWVYQAGPAGILLVFNLLFFAATAFSIYKVQREAKLASSSSSRNQDAASRAKLFCKLLIAMGALYIFEFISFLIEGSSRGHISWYWMVFDVLNVFQGVFIFIVFVCKKESLDTLKERYGCSPLFNILFYLSRNK